VERLKKRGITISPVVERFLTKLLDETLTASDYFADLTPYYDERDKLKSRITILKDELSRLEKRLAILEERISKGEVAIAEAERAKQSAMLFKEMNQIIVSCEFKPKLAWELCQGLVRQLKNLGQEIDYGWFAEHVSRVKQWLS